jgi:predicted DNA-binding transcriptional regulator AlpA
VVKTGAMPAAPLQTDPSPQSPDHAGFRDERSAASYLSVSVETLRTWRKQGRGPRYRKIGGRCVRYSTADLAAFIEAQPSGGGHAP